jgi:transcriptional regulator with XRE-family HTH domain
MAGAFRALAGALITDAHHRIWYWQERHGRSNRVPVALGSTSNTQGPFMAKKGPNPVDKHVGSRVRMRRLMLGMSQTTLADGLGLTFQQVQKYEKGTNRIGASRLQHLASILQVPVPFFFEGLPTEQNSKGLMGNTSPSDVFEFLATTDGVRLARAFTRIPDAKLRRTIVDVAEQISGPRKS